MNGLRHGRGIWKALKDGGNSYEGEYQNDKKCGYGEYKWATGNTYKGNFDCPLKRHYSITFLIKPSFCHLVLNVAFINYQFILRLTCLHCFHWDLLLFLQLINHSSNILNK